MSLALRGFLPTGTRVPFVSVSVGLMYSGHLAKPTRKWVCWLKGAQTGSTHHYLSGCVPDDALAMGEDAEKEKSGEQGAATTLEDLR